MYLTTDHSASSYGNPVLVDPKTQLPYGVRDRLPSGELAADYVRKNLHTDPLAVKYLSLDELIRKAGG